MNFEVVSNALDNISADAILVFAFEDKESFLVTKSFSKIDKVLNNLLSQTLKADEFKGKEGELFSFPTFRKIFAPKIFVLGLGKKSDFNQNKMRTQIAGFAKSVKKKIKSVSFELLDVQEGGLDFQTQSQSVAEGLFLGSYEFNKYKKQENDGKKFETVVILSDNENIKQRIKEGVKSGEIFSKATIVARDLVNEPSIVITPASLAKMALEIAKKNNNIKCTVYDLDQIEKMGMGAFLGIARGSITEAPPKFIFLEYKPNNSKNNKNIAIVGKGITFDSGGVSIKVGDSMRTMKLDMAGAAAVLGVFSVISEIKPNVNVMGVVAATPNLISAKATVPGDILKAMNGKTIEIGNMDAEGRVTLADSLAFAVKNKATEIIDLATLTGACEIALGTDIAGLFSNNEKLKEGIKKSAEQTGEKVWELPLVKEYKDMNKSEVADISNIPSSRDGGAITAALFLEEFVDKKPWVHMDIAGPAYLEKSYDLGPKGGTGFGVRMLLNYLLSQN